jgi:hypothetical protein
MNVSMFPCSDFKKRLCKIEGIEIFSSDFLRLTLEFLALGNDRDANFFMLRTEIVLCGRLGCLLT